MKIFTKILLALFTLVFSYNLNAAVLTVSNNPQIPAQYSDAQVAYLAAANGDVLYLHGSGTGYSISLGNENSAPTTKKVRIVGPGFNPTGQNNLLAALTCSIQPANETAMDNISIEGINVASIIIYNTDASGNGNFAVNNLQLTRCNIGGAVYYSYDPYAANLNPSVSFVQSIVNFSYTSVITRGLSIVNSVIFNLFPYYSGPIQNAYIKNCTLWGPNNDNCGNAQLNISGSVIENCIFKRVTNCYGGGENLTSTANVYNNCLFDIAQSAFGADNAFNDCLFSTPANFTDETWTEIINTSTFFNDIDLRPAAGSAALNAGPGGTVIGITGGNFPFINPKTQGRTTLPQLNSLSISSTSVQQNGNISVTFQAAKQD